MGENRITYFGWTDYSIASLELIISDLKKDFHDLTEERIENLEELKKKIIDNLDRFDDANEIVSYIEFCVIIFQSFKNDFKRVLDEISQGIEKKHIDIINQIHKRSSHEDENCAKAFKEEHIARDLKDETLRPLLDEIYVVTRDLFYRNKVLLSTLSKRLQTFIGSLGLSKEIPSLSKEKKLQPFPTPEGATWGDVFIRFLSDKTAEINVKNESDVRNYAEMGFKYKKSGKPTRLWDTLKILAKTKGDLQWRDNVLEKSEQAKLKKNISDLRKTLKQLFNLNDDPFYPYNESKSYKIKFNISELEIPQERLFKSQEIEEVYEEEQKQIATRYKDIIDGAKKDEIEGKKNKS